MSVRVALGASRSRLIRQLLTESLLLALIAGALGAALAYAGLPAILSIVPPDTIPDESEIALNRSVLLFALVLSALTSVACGLAPALHGSRRDLAASMREVSRALSSGSGQARLRKSLVVAEIALSLMLLAGSSLLIRTFVAMQHLDLGYQPERFLTMRIPLAPQRYPDAARRVAFFQDLLSRVATYPGWPRPDSTPACTRSEICGHPRTSSARPKVPSSLSSIRSTRDIQRHSGYA
jgi:hypothetical protein